FEHIDAIARTIADFHQRAERGREVAQYGSTETIRLNWDENFSQTMEFRGQTIGYQAFREIKSAVERFIVEHRALFRYRREAGFVRRCHGDLHSKNIFVNDGVHIFDCIEFNPRFSCSDVASEIAFMVMDLEYAGRHDLAGYFVERYLVYSRDSGLLKLLDFYKCYRAYVRGKVTSFNLNDPGMSSSDKAQARLVARRYFELSRRYAARLSAQPKLVVMMGLPGTGKSYVARHLAERLGAFHLMSDSIRKQLLGISLSARRFEGYGKGIYKGNIGRKTYDEMMRRAKTFVSAGHSTIMDATFLHPDSRRRAQALARAAGVPLLFVFADCPEKTVVSRLRRRSMEGSFSDATIAVYREMKRRFKPPRPGRSLVRINTREPLSKSLARIERALLRI
ncbi:MAG: AAA family ATPase, partial [candidate division WOR-3 bacterium]